MTFFQQCSLGGQRRPGSMINTEGVRMNKSASLQFRSLQSMWDNFIFVTVAMLATLYFRMDSLAFGSLFLCRGASVFPGTEHKVLVMFL